MVDKTSLLAIVEMERALHPGMDEQDLQKLIYQSALGGDHLLGDAARFAAGVRAEWERLGPDEATGSEPVLQTIDPEGGTARIHLGPCLRRGVDVERLIGFLTAQPRKDGRRSEYDRRWRAVIALAVDGAIPFDADKIRSLGFPRMPPHHSPGYGPASYRIVHDVRRPETADALRRLGV